MSQTAIDERNFQALDTIVGDVGHQVNIVDVKLTGILALAIDTTEDFDFILIKVLSHLLHHPDVAEKLSAQITITHHSLLNHTEMGIDEFDDLVLRTHLAVGHLIQPI